MQCTVPAGEQISEEVTLAGRAAALSTQLAAGEPASAFAAAAHATAGELVARLDVIEEAMRSAMREGVDYGRVPGSEKPGLWKPGAEKLAVMFRLDVQPKNELLWAGEHLTVISRATVYHAPSGARLGYGEGICTTHERKYAKRHEALLCPACGAANIRKSRQDGEGYYCWRKTGGCGATFPQRDERIDSQTAGEIDNPDLPDVWNTIGKMAKKRAYVDAVLSVTAASAIFTQDIGSDPTETTGDPGPAYGPPVAAEAKSQATSAAIRLCGGDVDHARALWQRIQATLGGYMPYAAATALVHAADALPDPSAAVAATEPSTPATVDAAPHEPAPEEMLVDRTTVDDHADSAPVSAGQRPGHEPGADDADAISRATADQRAARPNDGDQPRADRMPGTAATAERVDAGSAEIQRLQDHTLELWGKLVPAPEAIKKVRDANANARVLRIPV
ncbi:MAG: hypothetical protein ABSG43_11040 [Solirubrobacteraceae bacterium]